MWNQLRWTTDNGTSVTDLNGVYILELSDSVCSVKMNPVAWLVYLNLSTQLTWLTFHQSDSPSLYYSWVQKHQKTLWLFQPVSDGSNQAQKFTIPLSQTPVMTQMGFFWYGSMVANPPTTSSPHQLIMVTIIAVISGPNCRPILRPYCLNGKNADLLRRCPVSVHHFGLDPCAPWTPPLSSPSLIPSCLHYRHVEVRLCKGRGLGVMLSFRRALKIGVVWF